MNESDKNVNELLSKLTKQDELKNKRLLMAMWVILITNALFYIALVFLATFTLEEGLLLSIIIVSSTIMLLISCFIALKFEVDAGYYECKKCHHKFVPTYSKVLLAMHIGTTRYLKCPECNEKSWCKKVLTK